MRDEELAEVLRNADFALQQSTVAIIAYVRPFTERVRWDCERNALARKQIAALLEHLPPPPPLTPEQEAEAGKWISKALDRIQGLRP